MDSKKPWQSKTIIVNLLLALLLAALPFWPGAQGVHDWIAGNLALIGAIWSGLNILLRLITKDKIALGD